MSSVRVIEGTLVRSNVEFRNPPATSGAEGELHDPPTVKAHWKAPDGSITSYVYLVDPELERDGVGAYHIDLFLEDQGRWWIQWEGVDLVVAEDYVVVVDSKFD